jgi:uncharacterized membrane protein YdjX (TVP38/TMEM64 family)
LSVKDPAPDKDNGRSLLEVPDNSARVDTAKRPQTSLDRVPAIRLPALQPSTRRKIDILIFASVAIIATAVWIRPELINMGGWGYFGAFLINAISTATILLPAPGFAVIFAVADQYDPVFLGIATGLGGATGSLTAYRVGSQGRRFIKRGRIHSFLANMMEQFGGSVLFLFSFIFFMPADIASIIAGSTKYPIKRYFLYVSAGHVLKMVLIFLVLERYGESLRMLF